MTTVTEPDRMALLPPVPGTWQQRPLNAQADYMTAVVDAITNHPRSLQKRIGPSEVGDPCARKLLYKLTGTPERDLPPNWRATVGTGGHMWQEETFDRANLTFATSSSTPGVERWLIEERVTVGVDANGNPITGSCDLFDRATGTVIDHKFVGPKQLRKYKAQGPSDTYRVQAHLYGQGYVNAGLTVNAVAISFLPRDGDLADAYWWSEPFNPQIAANAMQRLQGLQIIHGALGDQAFAAVDTADSYCNGCPFRTYATGTPLHQGCPGHGDTATRDNPATQLDGLLPVGK